MVKLAQQRGHKVTALVGPTSSYVAPEGVSLLGEGLLDHGVLFSRSNVSISHTDLVAVEEPYSNSELDWLPIRPATLKKGGPTNTAKNVSFYGLRSKITKGEVARLMLDAAEQAEPFSEHTPLFAG